MQKEKFAVSGMSCAACAARVEHAVCALDGVASCQVNLLQNSMQIAFDEEKVNDSLIEAAVKAAGYGAKRAALPGSAASNTAAQDEEKALARQKRDLCLSFILTLALMSVSMLPMFGITLIADAQISAWTQAVLAALVMLLQRHYFIRGFKALFKLSPNMDSLVALGSAVSFLYSLYQSCFIPAGGSVHLLHQEFPLYFESAASILCLVGIGKYFEHKAKVKSSSAVSALIDLSPKLIRVRQPDGSEKLFSPDKVQKGAVVILRAGESLGVDGVVLSGDGFMDESSLTGESLGRHKGAGDKVLSGTILTQGYLEVEAEAVGADTTFAKIVQLMDDTVSQKVPIARLADVIAFYFVPAVITLALITFAIWYLLVGWDAAHSINFALCVLVVSCPCALGLATPTAVMVGMGRAARMGILFRNLEVLEILNKADVFLFDKTGTLTTGNMQLLSVVESRPGIAAFADLLTLSLESKSAHPIAKALVEAVKRKNPHAAVLPVENFKELPGLGVSAEIAGQSYALGNIKLVDQMLSAAPAEQLSKVRALAEKEEACGHVVLHLISGDSVLCSYILGDSIKPGAKELIAALHQRGAVCSMLTGDRTAAAAYVSNELGLDSFKAELLAADKLSAITALQNEGHKVVMLGDGVNDALCLAKADVGIGVHGASDVAVSACDLVFMNSELRTLEKALALSAATYRNIKQNLFWAFIYNVLTIPLAAGAFYTAFGWQLTPMVAAFLMSLSSICVVSNALRLNFVKLTDADDDIVAGSDAASESVIVEKEEKIMAKVISIDGMHCAHCTASVLSALSALPGVKNVTVSLEEKCARGDFPESITDEMLKGVIAGLGFTVTEIK
ncbi:MAG: heavy metal translocating P-type ATPase [Proteobacteria bacterium]|uniref:Heavy metal translocating P-type ATPase n=1 Tax=Candidatus Avisuccinivibrio stercorigallinarum TaxID=2840704 RepID=A0A9D9GN64_9GAMM|nr:heavy metal translocating P-type ATPase [Candidatus Avisuccinivibrio stercorigallinarum]